MGKTIEQLADLHIREATSSDKTGIISLVSDVMREFGLPVNLKFIETDIESTTEVSIDDRAKLWIATLGNVIVASIAIIPKSERECLLKRFYIMRQYRGLGLGRQLYEIAEQFAHQAGYNVIELEASRRFTKAIVFYHRNGYQLIREIDNAWEDNIYQKFL